MISDKYFYEIKKTRIKKECLSTTFFNTNYFQIKSNDLIACATFISFTFIGCTVFVNQVCANSLTQPLHYLDNVISRLVASSMQNNYIYQKCIYLTIMSVFSSATLTISSRYLLYFKHKTILKIKNKIETILTTNTHKYISLLLLTTLTIHTIIILIVGYDKYSKYNYQYIDYLLISINTTLTYLLIEITSKRFIISFSLTTSLLIISTTSIYAGHISELQHLKTIDFNKINFVDIDKHYKLKFVINNKEEEFAILYTLKDGFFVKDKTNSYRLIYNKCIDEIKLK